MLSRLSCVLPWKPFVRRKTVGTDSGDRLEYNDDEIHFLQADCQYPQTIALFHPSEVRIGDTLLDGSFTRVCEVKGISLRRKTNKEMYKAAETEIQVARRSCESLCIGPRGQSQFVIKSIKRGLASSTGLYDATAKMMREIQLLSVLHHPNIAQIRGSSSQSGCFLGGRSNQFILLDKMSESLNDRIRRWRREGPTTGPDDALIPIKTNYAFQIAGALKYLHEKRIVCRDLKPVNIGFRSERHMLQLFDFSNARSLPEGSDDPNEVFRMTLVGTRRYVASEVINSRRSNAKADVYSWSMIFYEMLSEKRPYHRMSVRDHRQLVCEEGKRPILSLRFLTRPIELLLRGAWEQDVEKRLSITSVCHALMTILMTFDFEYNEISFEHGEFLFPLNFKEEAVSNLDSAECLDLLSPVINDDSLGSLMPALEAESDSMEGRCGFEDSRMSSCLTAESSTGSDDVSRQVVASWVA